MASVPTGDYTKASARLSVVVMNGATIATEEALK
jgi:hypothetical protein